VDPADSGVESSPQSVCDSVWGACTGVKKLHSYVVDQKYFYI
jgi:hypothetical protein